jgi:hypothetical protein
MHLKHQVDASNTFQWLDADKAVIINAEGQESSLLPFPRLEPSVQ